MLLLYSPEQFCVLICGCCVIAIMIILFALLLNKQHQQSVILRPVNSDLYGYIRADIGLQS